MAYFLIMLPDKFAVSLPRLNSRI